MAVVLGIRRHLRSEAFKLNFRQHATPLAVATRALAYGTGLCLGSFLLLAGTLSVCSGIYSPRRFEEAVRTRLAPLRRLERRTEGADEDIDLTGIFAENETRTTADETRRL